VRHFYNCGGIKHFIAECPYENKEDHSKGYEYQGPGRWYP
jgi:hypothetical protein